MKKVLISRFGAYGDHIHCSHLPKMLKEVEGFDHVAFEYNNKGEHIHRHNPYIDEHILFEPSAPENTHRPVSFLETRWKILSEGFDRFINLMDSLERGYIAMEDQAEYYISSEERRKKYGKLNYYDQTSVFAGFPHWKGAIGQIDFSAEEEECVKNIFEERYKEKFVIICNLSGTSRHKAFYGAEEAIKMFLSRHDDAVCILTGDEESKKHLAFEGDRIINRAGNFKEGRYPFRQSMLMTKYANLVIGCESGLMVAATLLGAPTIQLMTAASIKNHGGDFKNDYSLQSPAVCSPCHKGPYDFIGCPKIDYLGSKYPACIKFETKTVVERMEKVYADSRTPQTH